MSEIRVSEIRVRAHDGAGRVLLDRPLGHGEHPVDTMWRAGLRVLEETGVEHDPTKGCTTLLVDAVPLTDADPAPTTRMPGRDAHLVVHPGEVPVSVQRLAVAALVRSSRGVLLAQLSARTNLAGWWTLPGGGVDPGETPIAALHREVFEETGQRIDPTGYLTTLVAHWVGRAPDGRLEDFHAVRLVFAADCSDPVDPVVHDVDGTTSAASWVSLDGLDGWPLAADARRLLRG